MTISVTFAQFVKEIVTLSFVDTRGELAERLVSKRARVHQRRDESTRSFAPVVVAAITSTTSRDVQQAPRSQNCAVPR
jgi:hypothetical protein